ncbi:PREDICTED: U11/U12 small nuclear ribonucleoprotein 48 kDa protein [Ficedula albicollis]|uniref:U11/U12 small nuclear ribonucleoprotein 48 kDa protein n=1 Tax=Ficedula albicollis TaxID=59894 RepID=UPI000359DFEF|nr:PREDICTED: U11/U12 small nuclear ribonucleoprotein 48 kDa protein [Ficedula albicollis]
MVAPQRQPEDLQKEPFQLEAPAYPASNHGWGTMNPIKLPSGKGSQNGGQVLGSTPGVSQCSSPAVTTALCSTRGQTHPVRHRTCRSLQHPRGVPGQLPRSDNSPVLHEGTNPSRSRLDGAGEGLMLSCPATTKRSALGAPGRHVPRPGEHPSVRQASIQLCVRGGKFRCSPRPVREDGAGVSPRPPAGRRRPRPSGTAPFPALLPVPVPVSRGGPAQGCRTEHRNFTLFTHFHNQGHRHSLVENYLRLSPADFAPAGSRPDSPLGPHSLKILAEHPALHAAAGWVPPPWVLCPYDVHHRVPRASLERHAASCRLRRMGYSAEEEAEMYDSSFFYENLKVPTVAMDKDLQFHIVKQARAQSAKEGTGYSEGSYSLLPIEVPQNHKRFTCDLTQADRLALYDYVVEETKKQRSRSQITENDSDLFVDLAAKITQDDSQKGPKSHLEILAEMRDYKRRRQSYRAKNVHITKKSYTEVIRDVIGVHMEELSNQWQEENRLDNAEVSEGGKSKSSGRREDRRSASVDSRQSGGSSKDTECTRHRRDTSRSPSKRRRSRERGRDRDSRRKRERDEDKYHNHKRRK